MSHSSRESELAQLREALAQMNSEFFLTLSERRALTLKIQELKKPNTLTRYAHFDPEREKEIFTSLKSQLSQLSIKELLAFSLVMEDQATAMAPGSYPGWSNFVHIMQPKRELYEMINPQLLKIARTDFFNRLTLSPEFSFLKDF